MGGPRFDPFAGRPWLGGAPIPQEQRMQVALLLPLSGAQAPLGRAMLNAAQLALFEQGGTGVEFVPRDTGGTPAGAAEAARTAVANGARILVGPLTAGETSAAGGAARAARAPMLAFTNDSAQAGGGVWALGVTPAQQARRVAEAAAASGARRLGVLAPDNEFGRRLAAGMRAAAADLGLPPPTVVLHPARAEMGAAARSLADAAGGVLDAVLIGESGERARQAAAGLAAAGLGPPTGRMLGHALWAGDGGLGQEPALIGALFAAPDPGARARFEARYEEAFGERPPRIAGAAYDAAGLAARAAARGRGEMSGEIFLGADGPLRLLPDGSVARGLAVFAIDPSGEARVVEPAGAPLGPGA